MSDPTACSETTTPRGVKVENRAIIQDPPCSNCERPLSDHLQLQVQERGLYGRAPITLCPTAVFRPTEEPKEEASR